MSHSHLAIRHLVKQLDELRSNGVTPKSVTPEWLVDFVNNVADVFEPFRGVARVGYECHQGEEAWEVALYLGETEIIGGPHDGEMKPVNFTCDLLKLQDCFESVETCGWNAFPDTPWFAEGDREMSFIIACGIVATQPIRVQIHASPLNSSGPAMKSYPDGSIELA